MVVMQADSLVDRFETMTDQILEYQVIEFLACGVASDITDMLLKKLWKSTVYFTWAQSVSFLQLTTTFLQLLAEFHHKR